MKEVLERYEYLMVYRLMDGRGLELDADMVRSMLDGYYKLRKAVEEERIPAKARIMPPDPEPAKKPETEPPKMSGQGAKIKNEALALYDQLRRAGVTRTEIVEAGQGSFGETELDLMVNRRKVDFAFWQAFHETLSELAAKLCLQS